jgi:heme exporter protein D
MTGDPHTGFILAAYAFAAVLVAGLIGRSMLDHRAQLQALARLEQSGLRRRSGGRGQE